jgi:hypothetical protein
MLTLAEDLFLLASDDATGRPRIPAAYLDLGLGGALLRDLALHGRVALADDHVVVLDRTPVGDPLLDAALRKVADQTKPREPDYRVRHLAHGARTAVERRLVERNVLAPDDHRLLGVIPVHHTHQVDDRIEHDLERRLHEAVVLDRPASPETAALASLALAVGLDRHLFPRADRRAVRRRMEDIGAGDWVGPAVAHAIAADDATLGIVPER